MRPIETPFQAQLPTSLGVPNYISSGSSWLPHHILFFSLCLKGRYADFELCFIAQNQMQYRNIQYCCYPDFCPLFLHIFLSLETQSLLRVWWDDCPCCLHAMQDKKVQTGCQWLRGESQRQYCSLLLFPRKQMAVRWWDVVKQRACALFLNPESK